MKKLSGTEAKNVDLCNEVELLKKELESVKRQSTTTLSESESNTFRLSKAAEELERKNADLLIVVSNLEEDKASSLETVARLNGLMETYKRDQIETEAHLKVSIFLQFSLSLQQAF